jgi:hypothetical protein
VERRKPITEEDVRETERMITRSFENLKQSAIQTSRRSIKSAGGSLKQHPFVLAGAAIGAGILLYGIFRLATRNTSAKKSNAIDQEYLSRSSGATMALLTLMIPLVRPYISTYLENYVAKMFSKGRH